MKVALLLSGKMRFVEKCFSSIYNNIISPNDCDVYMQTYLDSVGVEKAIDIYKPKAVLLESEESIVSEFKSSYPNCKNNQVSVPFQWRNLRAVFSMIEEKQYDCVIRSRYDIKFSNILRVNDFDMNLMNIPMGADFCGGIFDMFAFSSQKNMKWYMSIFDFMENYDKISSCTTCHPETMMLNHLQNSPTKFPINRFDYPVFVARGTNSPLSGYFEFFNNHKNLPYVNEPHHEN